MQSGVGSSKLILHSIYLFSVSRESSLVNGHAFDKMVLTWFKSGRMITKLLGERQPL